MSFPGIRFKEEPKGHHWEGKQCRGSISSCFSRWPRWDTPAQLPPRRRRHRLTARPSVSNKPKKLLLWPSARWRRSDRRQIALEKARSAALFRRLSKAFEDALAGGRTAILAIHGALPLEGGVPIISGGKLVGAIGASGGTAQQDGQVAQAGAEALK